MNQFSYAEYLLFDLHERGRGRIITADPAEIIRIKMDQQQLAPLHENEITIK